MKHKSFLTSIIISLSFSLTLFGQANNNKSLTITHLKGDFYVYITYNNYQGTPYPSNSMYVVTESGVVLIDTPWDTTQCQPLLDSIERKHHKKVVMSISTHYHADRTAGLNFFKQKGIKTYSSKQTQSLCKEYKEEQAQYTFTKDTTFKVGNHTFQTYHAGEGHTKDNIVVWFDKEKVLYGGCLVKSTETNDLGNVADANLTAWPGTINNVIKKFPKRAYVIPGHLSWEDNNSLTHTLNLLKQHDKKK